MFGIIEGLVGPLDPLIGGLTDLVLRDPHRHREPDLRGRVNKDFLANPIKGRASSLEGFLYIVVLQNHRKLFTTDARNKVGIFAITVVQNTDTFL